MTIKELRRAINNPAIPENANVIICDCYGEHVFSPKNEMYLYDSLVGLSRKLYDQGDPSLGDIEDVDAPVLGFISNDEYSDKTQEAFFKNRKPKVTKFKLDPEERE